MQSSAYDEVMDQAEPVWLDPRVVRGFERQLKRRRDDLAHGSRPLGWKTGLASPAAMAALKTTGGLVGYMTDATRMASGATIDIAGWANPVLEPEIAARLTTGLTPGASREQAQEAIDALAPAIEIADLDQPIEDPEEILSGNIFHRAVILGPFDRSRARAATDGIRLSVKNRSQVLADEVDPLAIVGDLTDVTRHVANVVGNLGGELAANDVIITGSAIPALPLARDDHLQVHYYGLGSVSVQVIDGSLRATG